MADKPTSGRPHTSSVFDKAIATSITDSHPLSSSSSLFSYSHLRPVSLSMDSIAHPVDRSRVSMAPPPLPAQAMEANKLDINSLMSPPDALHDSFGHQTPAMKLKVDMAGAGPGLAAKQPLPMSPPVSPHSKPVAAAPGLRPPSTLHVQDPVLYPADDNGPTSPLQAPLFAPAELEHRRIVDQHVRARSQSIFAGVAPPRREEYELVLMFRSQVMKHYTTDRKGWLRKERALFEADRRAGAQRYNAIMPGKPVAAKSAHSQRADRVTKNHGAPRQIRNPGAGPARPPRPAGRISTTPEPTHRIVAPNREDKDFDALPDYCPPTSSLAGRSNSLRVDWKSQPIDLTNDANACLLHADELTLAGNLRLDCATYLTSKRRIFERRLQCLRTGKEFRKTDAQQACKIDVNKASKLWTAFDKVGWLNADWMFKYL